MIDFELELTGLARKLFETSEDTIFNDGLDRAIAQSRLEIEKNFVMGGRPTWPLTEDGRVPLQGPTGRLREACSRDATVAKQQDGFEMQAAGDQEVVADVQDRRYGIFVLPLEAQEAVATALEEGMMT